MVGDKFGTMKACNGNNSLLASWFVISVFVL